MKVVKVDSYDRAEVSDELIHENLSESEAKAQVDYYNSLYTGKDGNHPWWYKAVEDDYVLYDHTKLY